MVLHCSSKKYPLFIEGFDGCGSVDTAYNCLEWAFQIPGCCAKYGGYLFLGDSVSVLKALNFEATF